MHGTFNQSGPAESGGPMRGTFYPGEGSGGGKSVVAILPKLLSIAQFHRELHAEDDAQSASTGPAAKGVKA